MHIRIRRKWGLLFFRPKLLLLTNVMIGLGLGLGLGYIIQYDIIQIYQFNACVYA